MFELYNFNDFKSTTESNHKRITTLFDAIIAIAMTMMALEISVTGFQTFDMQTLLILFDKITVYLISFVALASIWGTHTILYSSFMTLGSIGSILMNIVLMFLITIFPILTKLMSAFHQNIILQYVYIGCFLLMETIMALFFIFAKRQNMNNRKMQLEKVRYFIELKNNFQKEHSTDFDIIQNKLILAEKYFFNKEISNSLFQELLLSLPEQVQKQYQQQKLQNRMAYSKALSFLINMFFVVTISVVILIKNPLWCYFIFLCGGFSCIIGNISINYYFKKERIDIR
nr:TMEM175 family protein [uncultured Acetobacterium sp.]